MELIKVNKTYHLAISPRTILIGLAIQAAVITQVVIWSTKSIIAQSVTATIINRDSIEKTKQKVNHMDQEIERRFGLSRDGYMAVVGEP